MSSPHPSPQGLGLCVERDAEKLSEPEVVGDSQKKKKKRFSRHIVSTAHMNLQGMRQHT